MNNHAAKLLMDALKIALRNANDAQLKFAALEKALLKYEPNLYQAYLKEYAELRNTASASLNESALANLQSMLEKE
jgi:hypothetical protein